MALSRKQYGWGAAIVLILLLAFLFYYFKMRNKTEKCPDGSNIPDDGNCIKTDSTGNVIIKTGKPDASGCTQPSSYITNHFPLTLGMRGDLVKELQKGLNASFQSRLTADGFFGCNTSEALMKSLSVSSIDAQLFKDKILTPASINPVNTYVQVAPIDKNGCDANGLNEQGFPCLI